MHENLDKFEGLNVEKYIISKDLPEEQNELYKELEDHFGQSLTFISDPKLELIDVMDMKNVDTAYRGYALMDKDGRIIFNTINDHWGEQIDKTVKEIKKESNKLK
ncbi:AhpC/TSA family protein [Bacillus sp. OK048]|nr:AhpC/TSA family protein [Bacillus sp. OK048]